MSEHQSRKITVSRYPNYRSKTPKNNFITGSGGVQVIQPADKTPAQIKSKSTLPKSLRYDLDNALVGLCDVWFEEIKPYLERNNIKVHVHGPDGENGQTKANGQGDSGAGADCTHLHPATTASRCELCRLLFNASNSIQSAVSQAACVAASSPDQAQHTGDDHTDSTECVLSQNSKLKEAIDLRIVKRKLSKKKSSSISRHLVPRLCLNNMHPGNMESKVKPFTKHKLTYRNKKNIKQNKEQPELKDASTQTDFLLRINTVNPTPRKSRSDLCRRTVASVLPFSKNRSNQIKDCNSIKILDTEMPPLFKNDLIDIIGEKHEKRLKMSYESPERIDASRLSSYLSLFSPFNPKKIIRCPKKNHWR